MGLACQKCFSCWSRKHDPEPGELSDAQMTALLRKVINEDNSQKLLGIFNESLINPNTPLPVTLQSQVDHKKLLCLLWTPLMLATYAQKLHVLRVLLDMQVVDVNAYDSSSIGRRRNALHLAARYNCLQSLEILVNCPRVAMNAKDVDGCTALHLAVITNNVRAVSILLHAKRDIDVNAKNNEGDTPAHLAADGGFLSVMQSLMRHPEFDVFAQDAQGRDVLERAQATCAHLPVQHQPPQSDEGSSSDQRSVDECTQLIHLISKYKARSSTDETVSDETKSYEHLASVKQGLATNFAVRLMSVSEHADTAAAETLWQVNNNLPLKFIGLGAPLGDVSDEDLVLVWNFLNSRSSGALHEELSTDTFEENEEQRSLIQTRAKAEHCRLLKVAIYCGDPTLMKFICGSIPASADLISGNETSSDIREALAWLQKAVNNPANHTRCRDWCWSQWLCFFAVHCDAFAARYEENASPHRHPLPTLKRVTDDCYALEIVAKRHMYVFDVLKYDETACAVSLKFHDELPPADATEQAKRLAPNELLECGEHYNQPTSNAKKTLLSIGVEMGLLECSLIRTRAILQQLQAGVRAA